MNTGQEPSWATQGEPLDQMVSQDMDFSDLLGLGDIDVSSFPIAEQDPNTAQYAVQHPNTPFNGDMSGMSSTTAHDFAQGNWNMQMDMDAEDVLGNSHGGSQEDLQAFTQQMGQWPGAQQHQIYRHPHQVPPTPNSYELHGGDPAQFHRQRQAFIEQQRQMHMQQAKRDNFTPLVSPAVTPQDVFQHPTEYAVPGTYFSPLTSPALQAQNAGQQYRSSHGKQPSTVGTPAAPSPAGNGVDVEMQTAKGNTLPDRARRSNKKTSATRSVGSRSGVRQSPVTKAQKRKSAALSASLSNHDLENLLHDPQSQQVSALRAATYSTDSSGAGSISPEPLSESLMGPPPRPGSGSTMQSPTIFAQAQNAQTRLRNDASPATPASLMSIDNPRRAGNAKTPLTGSGGPIPLANLDAPGLDDFALPPSAASNDSVPPTPSIDSTNATPRISASRKTPRLGPLSTAGSTRPVSATSSPAISAIASPMSATTPTFAKDARSRNSKKRGSVSGSSSIVSPALRPKISPSIKPLLPEGAKMNDSTQAYLLATKSNYTHLLEGTSLPGVSYPESLSSGLTSKRTSHKIAEQGRRNRINEALKEMQALLPAPATRAKSLSSPVNGESSERSDGHTSPDANGEVPKEDDDITPTAKSENSKAKDPKDREKSSKAKDSPKSQSAASEAKAANSKAATVENAIEYIRTLQQEQLIMAEAMKAKDSEVNDLRRKLRDVEFKLGGSSTESTSPEAAKSDS